MVALKPKPPLLFLILSTTIEPSHPAFCEIQRAYPDKIFKTLIPRNVRVSEAASHGQPVMVYDPTCRGAEAYRQLAEEVMSR